MNGRNKDWAFGVLVSVALGLSGWSLAWVFSANAKLALIQQSVDSILADTESDTEQNGTLRKHWKLLTWSKDQINGLRTKQGLEIVTWPDF